MAKNNKERERRTLKRYKINSNGRTKFSTPNENPFNQNYSNNSDTNHSDNYSQNNYHGSEQSNLTDEQITEKINILNRKNTNLVFSFGYTGSSKTTILAALNKYLRENYLVVENMDEENREANTHLHAIRSDLDNLRFPPVTDVNKLFEYDLACRKNSDDEYLNLTFLEMSGEKHRAIGYNRGGKFPREVEIYLKENQLPIIVLLIVGYPELMGIGRYKNAPIDNQDDLISTFINYLVSNRIECVNVGLIISKFDRDKTEDKRLEVVQEKLKASLNQIRAISNSYRVFPFSIGEVQAVTNQQDSISSLDLRDCEPIVQWIFENFPNDFTPPPRRKKNLLGNLWKKKKPQ